MAKSLDKKKPLTSFQEYGENNVNFYDYSALKNDLCPPSLVNQNNNSFMKPSEKIFYKKSGKGTRKINHK